MRVGSIYRNIAAAIVALAPLNAFAIDANSPGSASSRNAAPVVKTSWQHRSAAVRAVAAGRSGVLQCVPFARENSGIELVGDAATWWGRAAGVYERGAKPEVGSVLNFRANGRMRLGHVAVVTDVVDSRHIGIDHANWAAPGLHGGNVSRNIKVVDVSERNDWSAVRVALGSSEEFGSIYPTYGFIYDRPDRGALVANTTSAPAPLLNPASRDLRPVADRIRLTTAPQEIEEVAEADDAPRPRAIARHGRSEARQGLTARRKSVFRSSIARGRSAAVAADMTKVRTNSLILAVPQRRQHF